MLRSAIKAAIAKKKRFDLIVIGGGASGLGVALDAVSRGMEVLLVEQRDFGKGTSSKATKLLHGGVRYLANGDVGLVIEALRERTNIINNAPHLSASCPFIIPVYTWWDALQYWIGLKLYDLLAGNHSLGSSIWMNTEEVMKELPNVKAEGLKGGVRYFDGQFDDARLCIDTVSTIHAKGGLCINYCEFTNFIFEGNAIVGIEAKDLVNGDNMNLLADSIVNASGVFFGEVMSKQKEDTNLRIVPSRGAHVVLDASFLDSDHAIMIPKTTDKRVLFIIPWKNVVIAGTTDEVAKDVTLDPKATDRDIDFILNNAQYYLKKAPTRDDIISTFAGLRPLAAPKNEGQKSKEISRSHKVIQTSINLFSILGGKWTTYRKMGEDTIDFIIKKKGKKYAPSASTKLKIQPPNVSNEGSFIHPDLPYTWEFIKYTIIEEMVVALEDVLARRTRCLFLSKEATLTVVDKVAHLIAEQNGQDQMWEKDEIARFKQYAKTF